MKQKIFTLLLLLLCVGQTWAIKYRIFNNEVRVVKVDASDWHYEDQQSYSGDVVIPSTITWRFSQYDVTYIETGVFKDCKGLRSISLPNTLHFINQEAFSGSGLTSITIPESVRSIGRKAFYNCQSLSSVSILGKNSYVYSDSFEACPITNLRLDSESIVNSYDSFTYQLSRSKLKCVFGGNITRIQYAPSGEYLELHSIPQVRSGAFRSKDSVTVVLDDNSYVYAGSNPGFPTVHSASYTRTMAAENQWGTLVLPFSTASNEEVQLYQLTAVTDDVMIFEPVDDVAANTPCVFKKKNESATNVTFTGNNVSIDIPEEPSASIDGIEWTVKGTYSDLAGQTSMYFIAQNKFWKADTPISIAPFRAYFEGNNSSQANARSFRIVVNDNEKTSIGIIESEELKMTENGKYIKNGKVVILRNGKTYNLNGLTVNN